MARDLAFWVFGAAIVLGGALALPYLQTGLRRLPGWLAVVHGGLGMTGFILLAAALSRGAPPQSVMGTSGFGPAATVALGLALAAGLAIAGIAGRGRRPPGILVAAHASLAIAGFVVLWTLLSLG